MTARRRGLSPEKQLVFVLAAALAGAAIIVAIVKLEQALAPPPEQVVTIYRTHGCKCAFTFVDSLEAAGFEVHVVELQSLTGVRASLGTPASLNGCHVGAYLDYFLEGHVAPAAVSALAIQRPEGLGAATESSSHADGSAVSIAADERSLVMLVGSNGETQPWFQPPWENDE